MSENPEITVELPLPTVEVIVEPPLPDISVVTSPLGVPGRDGADGSGGVGGADPRIGTMSDLTTTDKTTVVAAINEVATPSESFLALYENAKAG